MKRARVLNSYFIQFILLVILIVSFGGMLALALALYGFRSQAPEYPLGAPEYYIFYNNLLKAFLALAVIILYRRISPKVVARTNSKMIEYMLLVLLLYISNGFMQYFIAMVFEPVPLSAILFTSGITTIFRLNMVLAGVIVYWWSVKEEKREHNDINRALEVSNLRELKTKAELDALQSKVNPHFLYNSLNSINSLIDDDPEKAKQMVHRLSKLFRLSIHGEQGFSWTLREELDLVHTYLAIEQIRFGQRLKIQSKCHEAFMPLVVPRFILQPLVENAIKHGVSKLESDGQIEISVEEAGESIKFSVYDNGPPFSRQLHAGYGIQSLRDKLKVLNNGSTFEISEIGDRKSVIINLVKNWTP